MGLDTSAHCLSKHLLYQPKNESLCKQALLWLCRYCSCSWSALETISIVSKILLSLLLCNTLQQPKFSRLSCKLHIVWRFVWIQNWKPMQILQLFQPLDCPPHERSFCCLCHLCHNHSFQLPLPPEWVLWLLGISLTVDEFILVQILLCLSALVALL